MNLKPCNNPRNNGTLSNRKFKGFNFYIQCNEKLKKSNRERLLKESEVYLNEVTSSLPQPIEEQIRIGVVSELDSTLTDYELLEQWNQIYDEYGYLMSEFSEQWEREKMGKGSVKEKKPTIIQTLLDEIESLKNRLDKLEKNNNTSLLRSKSLSF